MGCLHPSSAGKTRERLNYSQPPTKIRPAGGSSLFWVWASRARRDAHVLVRRGHAGLTSQWRPRWGPRRVLIEVASSPRRLGQKPRLLGHRTPSNLGVTSGGPKIAGHCG